jgi:adenylate cyclase
LTLPVLNPISGSLLTFLAVAPIFYLGYASTARPLVPMEYSLLTVLVMFMVNMLARYFTELHDKQRLMRMFGQYVPPELVSILSKEPDRFTLAGEARELSVMFCDVHNFTTISEQLTPRELAQFLNTLFTIDKYMGDAIMAFWGAPLADPQHAAHALEAAFEMQRTARSLSSEFSARGWPEVAIGIGINSGLMNVGNMGSEYRVAYTVVGDAVNLAARLEALTRAYRTDIIVGQGTRDQTPSMLYRELDLVRVKGKTTAVRIYEPLSPTDAADPAVVAWLARHQEALASFEGKDWERARTLFRRLEQERPRDPLYRLYQERIELMEDPG